MTVTTASAFDGSAADPDELNDLADAIEAGADGWRDRVAALDRRVLTQATADSSDPSVIATRLRAIAVYLTRRREGAPFGKKEGTLYEGWKP